MKGRVVLEGDFGWELGSLEMNGFVHRISHGITVI